MKEYYVGLDIGTDSIGWAVTDTQYNVLKFRGNSMWGVRLFDESKTAQERRMFRAARRRNLRRRKRLDLLEMLFDKEISAKDVSFFKRLKESSLYYEDKSVGTTYAVFADKDYTDKDYYKQYPTIYHLRADLIKNPAEHDVRLVFLALHHLLKNRGHFLFDNLSVTDIESFDKIFGELTEYLSDNYDIFLTCNDSNKLSEILKDRSIGKVKKTAQILECCGVTKKGNPQIAAILSTLSGSSVKLADIFCDDTLKEGECKTVSFSGKYEDSEAALESTLGERFELIEKLKAIYDWAILEEIRQGEKYISFAKVKSYNEHHNDLVMLKDYVKTYCPDKYSRIFRKSEPKLANYTAYCGKIKKNGHNGVLEQKCTQEEFCAFLKKELPKNDDERFTNMFEKIETSSFMPKQVTKDNGVIPMQINRAEVVAILDNAKDYLPFLSECDESGISVRQKILDIFDFRIPYYVGPLNKHSDKSWLVRKAGAITPWNFKEIVDVDKSAEEFINRLTSKCTYLPDKDVIPKSSLLYSKFMVLNELNNLRINGSKIDVDVKQAIYNDLFMTKKRVTQKALKNYFKSKGNDDVEITGIDGDFKSNLKPFIDLAQYNISDEEKEDIINSITIFGDDKRLLKKRLTERYSDKLSENDILRISKLKYSGWSSLSKEFLTDIYGTNLETGEHFNIIDALWETNDNLMVLLGSAYNFAEAVENARESDSNISMKTMVENLYVSPKVKRPIYQSLKIVKEIVKIMGCAPKKFFVEVARGPEEKKRTVSRKAKLVELYKNCKKESEELYNQLVETPENEFKRDKLYLYYTQFGKCMYTGEPISLDSLYDNNIYDIDHIFPRSKVKDDSLDNRVLVKKVVNAGKDNVYPLSAEIHKKMYSHWKFLLDKELISKKKFECLTRNYPLSDEELADFISRQLVETRQSTKAVASILKSLYKEFGTEVVYSKAGLVSDFRQDYDMLKCREVNDLHHAKDAYLNIVVGNVYNERFTHNKANFIKGLQNKTYSLNAMFNYNVKNAWIADNNISISTVKKYMNKNNILYTRYSYIQKGGLFDQMPVKKGKGQVPLKLNSPKEDISKYGAYNRPSSAFFAFVEYPGKKGKSIRALVPVDSYRLTEYNINPNKFMNELLETNEAKVLIKCVKYNSCLSFNGCRMHISSKSGGGKQIIYKPAVHLVVGYKWEKYIRNAAKLMKKGENEEITEFDSVSAEENIELFDILISKMTNTVMKFNLGSMGAKIAKKKEVFSSLSIWQQCFVLLQILNIIHANVLTGDLKLIKESGQAGTSTTNSKLSEIKNVDNIKLINQSVTGLFETEVNLI